MAENNSSIIKIAPKNIKLNDMLHIPLIKKILLSGARLTNNNNVIVKFDVTLFM